MLSLKKIGLFFFVFIALSASAQKDSTRVKTTPLLQLESSDYNPLAPAKAAFYSAVFPGMGQLYNKKYWKAPIVWGALGTSIYFYITNNEEYDRYRTAFKIREAGLQDEFTNDDGTILISRNGLINAQKVLKKNRDLSLLTTVLLYVLQVVEASVDAHLLQFNTNDNITFSPMIVSDPITFDTPKVGLVFKYSF
ncbi:MAG: DUF5683 domain-containing protein [Polaribacter sp.]|nr:DUF5683 domain-containing protein [Polaribacter sp.]